MENKGMQKIKFGKKDILRFFFVPFLGIIIVMSWRLTNHHSFSVFEKMIITTNRHSLSAVEGILIAWISLAVIPSLFRGCCLIIAPIGFIEKTFFFQNKIVRWSDVQCFEVASGRTLTKGVVFVFSESYRGTKNMPALGYDHKFLYDYGMKPEELADLLNKKRAEYLGFGKN